MPMVISTMQTVAPQGKRKFFHTRYWMAAGKVISVIGVIKGHQRRSFQSAQKSQSPAVSMKWMWKAAINTMAMVGSARASNARSTLRCSALVVMADFALGTADWMFV